jgi:AmmeMemoRadiSam system protein B
LKGRIDRAVIVGPAHYVPFRGVAAPSSTAFATPLGESPVDTPAIAAMAEAGFVAIYDEPHTPEHALEVELPFLQAVFGPLPIVPLLFGLTSAGAVAAALAEVWTARTLLVVSSDLSHYECYEDACCHDARTAHAIETLEECAIGPADACGHLAIRGALIEAKRRGNSVLRLDLRNSGDTAGGKQSVVGYGAWAFMT